MSGGQSKSSSNASSLSFVVPYPMASTPSIPDEHKPERYANISKVVGGYIGYIIDHNYAHPGNPHHERQYVSPSLEGVVSFLVSFFNPIVIPVNEPPAPPTPPMSAEPDPSVGK